MTISIRVISSSAVEPALALAVLLDASPDIPEKGIGLGGDTRGAFVSETAVLAGRECGPWSPLPEDPEIIFTDDPDATLTVVHNSYIGLAEAKQDPIPAFYQGTILLVGEKERVVGPADCRWLGSNIMSAWWLSTTEVRRGQDAGVLSSRREPGLRAQLNRIPIHREPKLLSDHTL